MGSESSLGVLGRSAQCGEPLGDLPSFQRLGCTAEFHVACSLQHITHIRQNTVNVGIDCGGTRLCGRRAQPGIATAQVAKGLRDRSRDAKPLRCLILASASHTECGLE